MEAIEDNAAGSAASLWVIGIQNLGITGLPGLINAMVLLSGISRGKGHLYCSVHKLTSLTPEQRKATLSRRSSTHIPRQVHRIWRPIYFVALVSLITCITFLMTAISYFGCKAWRGTKTVDPRTADLVSGKAEVDEECKI
ncbi:hypothetical protein H634G_01643 [Metarhizium anisopliae BRIP 53293]|uniref:Amino acid permease/ SLC12A domain-containing protein n=1 Tax=Metarhizium anisopliae BRIP 53293 TaxID=1291518 RepID=A0A0D9PB93_METAN|nr:hypothetical protein H634G_01643 [Metarhizium anisopliae BRIP 53293]KJK92376.1 hypothetical protein H633G_03733 [Metarhizium anisopliae BRIP 53284]